MMLWRGCGVDGDDVLHDILPVRRSRAAFPWPKVLMSQRFGTSARKAENGFVRRQNCFVGQRRDETFGAKKRVISMCGKYG